MKKEDQKRFYIELGNAIREARVRAEGKPEYVAAKLGISRPSLINIEQGNQRIQTHTLFEIANLFKISISELLPKFDVDIYESASNISDTVSKKIVSKLDDIDNAEEIYNTIVSYHQKRTT